MSPRTLDILSIAGALAVCYGLWRLDPAYAWICGGGLILLITTARYPLPRRPRGDNR